MKQILLISTICILALFISCGNRGTLGLHSPDSKVRVQFKIEEGKPFYRVNYKNRPAVDWSRLGFRFKYKPALFQGLEIKSFQMSENDSTWETIWGQKNKIRNHFHQMEIKLLESSGLEREFSVIFRAYNDGVGFRYSFPEQQDLKRVEITSEETEFCLNQNNICWWIPADYDSYELLYNETTLGEVDSVNTPITMKTQDDIYISLHEAALTDYAGMTLITRDKKGVLNCDLVPWPDGVKVKRETPFKTPWRTIQIGSKPGDLIESNLIVNLNNPSKISNTDWIQPMKYTGIWWGMHIGKFTWHDGKKHGATTERAKELIDFSARHKIPGMLVEGWNVGWDSWLSGNNVQNYTQSYPDFDIEEVVNYGWEKGVGLIGHHESGANVPMYEKQIQEAMQYYEELGIKAVKTGYAGAMKPEGMYHHGQWMVNHYRKVVKLAAEHQIMINAHEPIKPTGIRRTWPNMMTREGVRGMEYNAWGSPANPPEHTTILPFTRILAGPADYTPGIFDLTFEEYKPNNRVWTTLAKQLAYYVVLYSPMQMVADLPENYDNPAFQFIEDVPVDWDTTVVVDAAIGDHVVIARQAGDEWFLGGITDEKPRKIEIPLNFLSEDYYLAEIYCDAPETGLYEKPTAIEISKYKTNNTGEIQAALSTSGGIAIRFIPDERVDDWNSYETINSFNERSVSKMEKYKNLKVYK